MGVNVFHDSLALEVFFAKLVVTPSIERSPETWRAATLAEQNAGIDYHFSVKGKWHSVEIKTEAYPLNYFLELYQLVENKRSLELGYAYKCTADYLLLSNIPGRFAVLVPRAQFLKHAIDMAIARAGRQSFSLVVNADKGQVTRAAIGIAVPYVDTLKTFQGAYSLLDFGTADVTLAAIACLDKRNAWMAEPVRVKQRTEHMETGLTTLDALKRLKNRAPESGGTRLNTVLAKLINAEPVESEPPVLHRLAETYAIVKRGLVTKQAKYAASFTQSYLPDSRIGAEPVNLNVRATVATWNERVPA